MTANETQVGGTHYQTKYQHWDLVEDTGLGYLEGCATKYVSRWRKKGGIEDLKKGQHYLVKLIEVSAKKPPRTRPNGTAYQLLEKVRVFSAANELTGVEHLVIEEIVFWRTVQDLERALAVLTDLVELHMAEAKPVPLTEENHHAERAEPVHSPSGWPGTDQ